ALGAERLDDEHRAEPCAYDHGENFGRRLIAYVGDLQQGALGGRLTDARITDADVPALPSGVSGTARNDKPSRELKCYSSIIALCHAPACSESSGGEHVPYGDTAIACGGRSC